MNFWLKYWNFEIRSYKSSEKVTVENDIFSKIPLICALLIKIFPIRLIWHVLMLWVCVSSCGYFQHQRWNWERHKANRMCKDEIWHSYFSICIIYGNILSYFSSSLIVISHGTFTQIYLIHYPSRIFNFSDTLTPTSSDKQSEWDVHTPQTIIVHREAEEISSTFHLIPHNDIIIS